MTLAATWEHKYPAMVDMWKRSWEEFIPFLDFHAEVCRLIYTTTESSPSTPASVPRHADEATSPTARPPSRCSTWSFLHEPPTESSTRDARDCRTLPRVEALVGQCRQAVTPVNSRTPTSRSRFATADPPGRVRESHPGAVRASNGTRAGRRSHPRTGGRRTRGLDRVGRSTELVRGDMHHHCRLAGSICGVPSGSAQPSCRSHGMATRRLTIEPGVGEWTGKTAVALNTGDLRAFGPFGRSGLRRGHDGDVRVGRRGWASIRGAFERPVRHLALDDAWVCSSPSWRQQALQDLSERGSYGAGESAGGKMPPGR
jgi:hypothetical protein